MNFVEQGDVRSHLRLCMCFRQLLPRLASQFGESGGGLGVRWTSHQFRSTVRVSSVVFWVEILSICDGALKGRILVSCCCQFLCGRNGGLAPIRISRRLQRYISFPRSSILISFSFRLFALNGEPNFVSQRYPVYKALVLANRSPGSSPALTQDL